MIVRFQPCVSGNPAVRADRRAGRLWVRELGTQRDEGKYKEHGPRAKRRPSYHHEVADELAKSGGLSWP